MLTIYCNLARQATVAEQSNGTAHTPQIGFADYLPCRLIVYSYGVTRADLSHVASWRGAVDVDTDSDTGPLRRIMPGDFDATNAASGELRFPIDCGTQEFFDTVKSDIGGKLEIYGHDAEDRQIVRIRIAVTLVPLVDAPGGSPTKNLEPVVRALNGLTGNITLVDGDGEPLPVGDGKIQVPATGGGGGSFGGLYPDNNPVADLPFGDPDYGMCHYLDATFPSVSFTWPVYRLRKITALIRSANPAITGSIVLTPLIDGEVRPSVSVAVGANWTEMDIPLTVETGEVTLRRDVGGTLNDGGMVTAILRCITAWGEL